MARFFHNIRSRVYILWFSVQRQFQFLSYKRHYGKRLNDFANTPLGSVSRNTAEARFGLAFGVGLALRNTLPAAPLLDARGYKI
jgi:hypothetical protein